MTRRRSSSSSGQLLLDGAGHQFHPAQALFLSDRQSEVGAQQGLVAAEVVGEAGRSSGQVGQPVVARCLGVGGPLGQQDLFGQDTVPLVVAPPASWADRSDCLPAGRTVSTRKCEVIGPLLPWRQVTSPNWPRPPSAARAARVAVGVR
jgi:hypothetical protein